MDALLVGFVVYLLVVLVVGILAYRRTTTQSGFLLGDRKLGAWVISLSERASGESAWLLVGLPGAALAVGFLELWTAIGCCTGIFLSWTLVAGRLRQQVGRSDSLTLPDYFRCRYPETHEWIRILGSLLITFFFTYYVAAQFDGAGTVLETTFLEMLQGLQAWLAGFGLEVETKTLGMLIGALIVTFYTIMGGFLAVALTDFVQGFLMVFTCVVLPTVAFVSLGGSELIDNIRQTQPELLTMTGGKSGSSAVLAIIGGLSWGLGYMGQPHLLSRFMAINRPSQVRKGMLIATWWAVPAMWGATLIGIVGLGAYGAGFFENPEQVMPYMATQVMPGWLAGIMISGAIAAMMSTADSQLLVTTSTLSEDLAHKLMWKRATPEQLALLSRFATLVIGLVAFFLARNSNDGVFKMVSYAWSGLAAAFAPQLLLTLWWRRTTGWGVLAGMIGGPLTVFFWREIPSTAYGLSEPLTERVSGVAVALVLVIVVSLLTQNREARA